MIKWTTTIIVNGKRVEKLKDLFILENHMFCVYIPKSVQFLLSFVSSWLAISDQSELMNVTRQVVLTVNTHYKSFIRSFRGDLGKGCKTLALLFDYQSKSSSNRKNDCKQELQQPEIKSVKSLTQVYNVFGSYLESELNEKYGINVVKGADDGQQLEEAIERFVKCSSNYWQFKPMSSLI